MQQAFRKRSLLWLIINILFVASFNCRVASQTVNHWESLVMAGDTWHFFPGHSEPSSDWNEPDFNDTDWQTGQGGIGYGDDDDATEIDPVISLYIRTRFNVTDISAIEMAALHVDFDDGFVAYLNGHEIARANIGSYGIRPAFDDLAYESTYEANLPLGGIPARFLIKKDTLLKYLNEGENTLALQVHNYDESSSDLSSTTFLLAGINNNTYNYREVPSWFSNPFDEYSRLPLVVIDTRGRIIEDEPKITALLKVIDNGSGKSNNQFQEGTDYNGYIGIEVRGQSSQLFPKKSYLFETRDEYGANLKTGLLGMPSDEDWVLYAPYSDKSLMRNAVSYYLGSKLREWQPRFRFCEVYLNGDNIGIYMLVEKIKRDDNRIDIGKLKPEEISGDDLTGGYIIKTDKMDGLTSADYFDVVPAIKYKNSNTYHFTYVYPKAEEIVPQQRAYIKQYLTDFQNILNGSSFSDPVAGFRKYIDLYSFVDVQVIQELTKGVDGYRYSNYFYKKKDTDGGKLYAGPIWDFDLGYGNEDYTSVNLETSGWLYEMIGPDEGNRMHWWKRLMEDYPYRNTFKSRWRDLRKGAFNTDSVMLYIDNTIEYLGEAVDRNFQKWQILGTYVWPNYFVGDTYEEEVDYLKGWMTDRMQWIDENISNTADPDDENSKNRFIIYPNPVNDKMNLWFYIDVNKEIRIEMYDLLGRKMSDESVTPGNAGYQEYTFSTGNLRSGYYILRVIQDNKLIGRSNVLIERR